MKSHFVNSVFSISAATTLVASSAIHAAETTNADSLDAVVVTATRIAQPVSKVIGSVTILTRAEIETRQVESLQELLRGEAGIDIANSGGQGKASAIYLRGGSAAQTLILIDGVRLGSATAGTTSIEFLPIDQIERIEIVRGARSSLYGSDAIGGVIQIFTRNNSGITASASLGSHASENYSAGVGDQLGSLRFSVNGAFQQTDGFNSCVGSLSSGCYTVENDNDGYRNGSASARVGYAFGQVADLELRTLYAQGFSEFDGSYVNEVRFHNSAPTATLRITPTEALTFTANGGVTLDKNTNYKNGTWKSRFNTEKRNTGLQADWRIVDQQIVTLGADYLQDIVDSDTNYDQTKRDNRGVFAQYLGSFGTQEVSASLRRDHNQQFGNHHTGNAGWKWQVHSGFAVNAGYGTAFHAPSFNDLYYPWGYGNPNLKPERSRSIEAGVSGTLGAASSKLDWSLQGYSTQVDDLIALDSSWYPGNISKARLQGAELSINGQWQALTAAVNYTAQKPRSRAIDSYDKLLPRRSRQSARLNVGYGFGVAQVGALWNAVGKRFDDLANSKPLAGYTTVDFTTDVQLGKQFVLQAKVGNFFDRNYQTAAQYNQEGRTASVTLRYHSR